MINFWKYIKLSKENKKHFYRVTTLVCSNCRNHISGYIEKRVDIKSVHCPICQIQGTLKYEKEI